MISYSIQDSKLDGQPLCQKKYPQWKRTAITNSIDSLATTVTKGLTTLNWSHTIIKDLDHPPITYQRDTSTGEVKIFTQHYVGFYETNDVRIEIAPRLFSDDLSEASKWQLFCHLLAYANGAHLTDGSIRWKEQQGGYSWPWLMAILWLATLERGLSSNIIPKAYVPKARNLYPVKGRIDFSENIRTNLANSAKQFCHFEELSFDVPINRAILRTTHYLSEQNVPIAMLWEAFEHCSRLQSLGVNERITAQEIDSIEFNEINEGYRPAMNLARIILKRSGAGNGALGNPAMPSALFVDLASLWEEYIFTVLKRRLPPSLRIESPNCDTDRIFILDKEARPIRPDFLIYRTQNNTLAGVIDAKYKDYRVFGLHSGISFAVTKEDFYQMNTYLLHYGSKSTHSLSGIFVAPALMRGSARHNFHQYEGIANLNIGICNLPVVNLINSEIDTQKQFAQQIAYWLLDKD